MAITLRIDYLVTKEGESITLNRFPYVQSYARYLSTQKEVLMVEVSEPGMTTTYIAGLAQGAVTPVDKDEESPY